MEYEKALAIFEQMGRDVDYARTISGALQSLIYDGQYERAFRLGEQARAIFQRTRTGCAWPAWTATSPTSITGRTASRKPLRSMRSAYKEFLEYGEPLDIAAVLRNLAVCYYQPE